MSKIKPYLQTALTVLVVLAVYKVFIQPMIPASLQKYTPSV